MRALRHLVPAIVVGMALVPLAAGPASAAPPDNDVPGGAVALNLGDTVTQDTSQATTDAGDAADNTNCGAPFTNASVWYSYTPDAKSNVVLDTSASSYEAGLMIFDGTPSADSLLACGPVAVGFTAHPGTTYTIMAFSDNEVIGGSLVLSLKNAPTPTVHVKVAKGGVAFHGGGGARIHGTYRCTHDESFGGVTATLLQRAGRLKIQGQGGAEVRCNGKTHPWKARVVSPVGTYAKGHAQADVTIFACGILVCRQAKASAHVTLAWAAHSRSRGMSHPSIARTEHPHPLLRNQRHWPSS